MAKSKVKAKPFTAQGFNTVSPKGKALWCKIVEPDYEYNDSGVYQTDMVVDPNDPTVIAYIAKLEALRDEAHAQAEKKLKKDIDALEVFKKEVRDGEETGMIIIRFKMPNIDKRKAKGDAYQIKVIDKYRKPIASEDVPEIGNGSTIRCKAYHYAYHMAGNEARGIPDCLGVTTIWDMCQLIDLVEYSGGGADGFDDESGDEDAEGFEAETGGSEDTPASKDDF